MQIQVFLVRAGDPVALDEVNRFLRGHRVLSVDRVFEQGAWHFCVCHLASLGSAVVPVGSKVDYRQILDAPTFALFSRLREMRKSVAEREHLPPYAVMTNEQLAEVSRRRPATLAGVREVAGLGEARVEKYGALILEVVSRHAQQPDTTGGGGGAGTAPGGLPAGGAGEVGSG